MLAIILITLRYKNKPQITLNVKYEPSYAMWEVNMATSRSHRVFCFYLALRRSCLSGGCGGQARLRRAWVATRNIFFHFSHLSGFWFGFNLD